MGLHGCGKCMKLTMFVTNVLILGGGIAVLAVGIWTCVGKGFLEDIIGNSMYMNAAYIMIAVGTIIILISFIGCLGAIREIKCLLLTYFVILFILFVTLLIAGILGYVFRGQVKSKLHSAMMDSIQENFKMRPEIKDRWDLLQKTLQCCGVEQGKTLGYNAWSRNKEYSSGNGARRVPESCCTLRDDGVTYVDLKDCQGQNSPKNASIYVRGCHEATLAFVQGHALILGGVGIGISCILVLGMVFSCVLFKLIE